MYIYIYVYFIILSFILMYILQTYIFSIVFYFCCWLVSYTSFSSWRLLHGLHHVFLIITVSSGHEHSLLCDESFTGAPVSPAPPLMVYFLLSQCLPVTSTRSCVMRALQELPSAQPLPSWCTCHVRCSYRCWILCFTLFMQLLAFSFYRPAQVWSAHHEPHPL